MLPHSAFQAGITLCLQGKGVAAGWAGPSLIAAWLLQPQLHGLVVEASRHATSHDCSMPALPMTTGYSRPE